MKKSLVIISFAFILLLSMSVVSASWFGDLLAKITGKGTSVTLEAPDKVKKGRSIAGAGGEYECPPLPQGICDGDADPKSITVGQLREMIQAAGGEYECPPLPQGICDGDADPKSLAFSDSSLSPFKKGAPIPCSPGCTSGCGPAGGCLDKVAAAPPACNNLRQTRATTCVRTVSKTVTSVTEQRFLVNKATHTSTLISSRASASPPTGGERSLKGLNLTNATLPRTRELPLLNQTNQTSCTDACSPLNSVICFNNGVTSGNRTCGNFDSDTCLEWGPDVVCPVNQTCSSGVCHP